MTDAGRATPSSGPDSRHFAVADHEPSVIEASDLPPGALPEWDWPGSPTSSCARAAPANSSSLTWRATSSSASGPTASTSATSA
jgi:hypothetical protein